VQFLANLMDPTVDPAPWAREREVEGWDIVAASDHYFLGGAGSYRWFPHVWVTISQMAAATSTVQLTTTFVNNLFRNPVEFVQASLTMQAASGGRFQAGLGAGWAREELEMSGEVYPPARERADRYVEALQIVRTFFDEGQCKFDGTYYHVDVPTLGGLDVDAPLLVGSLGGPRTIRGGTPLVDRVELKGASVATRGGGIDMAKLTAIPKQHLLDLVDQVRRIRDDVPIGFFVLCAVGDGPAVQAVSNMCSPDSLYGGFYGPPEKVAESILGLEELGIDVAQVSPASATDFAELAPFLIS
jgi:hypothetical protein